MEKLAAWFLTEAGKRAVYISACVGTMFTFSLKAVPNTFFVEQYKDLFHYYEYVSDTITSSSSSADCGLSDMECKSRYPRNYWIGLKK